MVSEATASSVDPASVDPALVDMADSEDMVVSGVLASEAWVDSADTAWEVLVASEDLEEVLEDTAASEDPVAFEDLVAHKLPCSTTFKTQLQVLT